MEYFPIFIDLKEKNVLVIGEYRILKFKIIKMLEAGANILYLTGLLPEQMEDLNQPESIRFISDKFKEAYLDDIWLVVCGSDDVELKKKIVQATSKKNIFCNFVDEAPISSFISPSVISKGDITIAISTKGKSPALNKYLKNEIINNIGEGYAKFADILGKMRKKVIENIPGQKRRSELFDSIIQHPEVLTLIRNNNYSEAEELIEQMIDLEVNRLNKT
jgi:precorrin-2 dehydrogenase/sirohydrochlorin ferrochelatase